MHQILDKTNGVKILPLPPRLPLHRVPWMTVAIMPCELRKANAVFRPYKFLSLNAEPSTQEVLHEGILVPVLLFLFE